MARILIQEKNQMVETNNYNRMKVEEHKYNEHEFEVYAIIAYDSNRDWVRLGFWKNEENAMRELENIATAVDGYIVTGRDFEVIVKEKELE